MYRKDAKGWFKHYDFMLLDLLSLQAAFVLSFMIRHARFGYINPYALPLYFNMAFVIEAVDIVVIFLFETFKNILKRGYYQEFMMIVRQALLVELLSSMYLFTLQYGGEYSRAALYLMGILYVGITYIVRLLWKRVLRKKMREGGGRSLLIVTMEDMVSEVVDGVKNYNYEMFRIAGLVIIDRDMTGSMVNGIRVVANERTVSDYVCREWVDEIFINVDSSHPLPQEMLNQLFETGVTVHLNLERMSSGTLGKRTLIEKVGKYTVLTTSMNYATVGQAFSKRVMDIVGGLIGCLLTAVIFVFIAPAIYISSPGPIFFSQERVGRNGKTFKIYKFRSMYLDAEERKKELEKDNRIKDGRMFKLDFDPRIIGNKILPDGRKKHGIGHFIRVTSLDEFPQFFNVLKGEMSLVGTRPPLVSEYQMYELRHRARMSVKPGITGMWQVSGRSEITDFEEVVRLDTQYINEWSMGLDIKIILLTVLAILRRRGSM